jgi:hypothetical protein
LDQRGQCQDHHLNRFSPIFRENGVFLENQRNDLSKFESKSTFFLCNFLGLFFLKIITLTP